MPAGMRRGGAAEVAGSVPVAFAFLSRGESAKFSLETFTNSFLRSDYEIFSFLTLDFLFFAVYYILKESGHGPGNRSSRTEF